MFLYLKSLAKKIMPANVYHFIRNVKDRLFNTESEQEKLYKLSMGLPPGYYIQRIRSLELQGISDALLETLIEGLSDVLI